MAFVRTSWHLSSLAYSVIDRLKSIILTVFLKVYKYYYLYAFVWIFKIVSLFSYQGSDCLFAFRNSALLFYHIVWLLSTPFLIILNLIWKKERRKRDSNPRAACATYTLSRGASSASWVFLQKPNNAIITIKFYTLAKRMHI